MNKKSKWPKAKSRMSLARIKQRPMRLPDDGKRGVRTQFGALCWRQVGDKVQVLLITSRRRGRWIVPKGWPVHGATPSEAAATEAYEEAGVKGKVTPAVLGIFSYTKDLDAGERLPCVVALFPIKVKKVFNTWPEKPERRRKWMSLKKAAKKVDDPELASILKNFDPKAI
jgi:8-oxo-dGTP pyrophosphatase MutT (NUDIX family)